jgi:hypothetical protein
MNPTIQLGPEDTFAAIGMRGTGKTTLCRKIVRGWGPRTVVWDPFGQYPPPISYRPRTIDRREHDGLCRHVWTSAPFNLLVEEAEQVLPEGRPLAPAANQLFLMGRNLRIRWGLNTRHPAALKKQVLNECDHYFVFKLRPQSIEYMVRYLELAPRDARAFRKMHAWLKSEHRFFWYSDDHGLVPVSHWTP